MGPWGWQCGHDCLPCQPPLPRNTSETKPHQQTQLTIREKTEREPYFNSLSLGIHHHPLPAICAVKLHFLEALRSQCLKMQQPKSEKSLKFATPPHSLKRLWLNAESSSYSYIWESCLDNSKCVSLCIPVWFSWKMTSTLFFLSFYETVI